MKLYFFLQQFGYFFGYLNKGIASCAQIISLFAVSGLAVSCHSFSPNNSTAAADVPRQDTCVVIVDSLIQPYRDYLLPLETIDVTGMGIDSATRYTNGIQSGLFHFSKDVVAKSTDKRLADLESWKASIRFQDLRALLFFNKLKTMSQTERDKYISRLGGFQYGQGFITMDQIKDLFDSFSQEAKDSPLGRKAWGRITRFDGGIGVDVRDFYTDQLLTEQDSLSSLETVIGNDKPYKILFVGASWCRACRYGERLLKTWYNDLDTARLEIINVSIDKDPAAWIRSVEEDDLPWPSYLLQDISNSRLSAQFDFGEGIPLILLIDGNNRVIAQNYDIRSIIRSIPFICYEIKI